MACLFLEGFDKYGPVNNNATVVAAIMASGDWTTTASNITVVAGLSTTGFALNLTNGGSITRALGANYPRLIGGFRFSSPLTTTSIGVMFLDAGTAQASVTINTSGTISVKNGPTSGTVLATSTAIVGANSTHYLEYDITFSNTGNYQVWLDGVSILSGTGDTTGSVNNYANQMNFSASSGVGAGFIIDDIYLFDTTGTINNAVLLTSPRIETTLATSDNTAQFSFGAAVLGSTRALTTGVTSFSANQLALRAFVPTHACTLNSINIPINAGATTSGVNLRGVVYADSAGVPGALLSSGSTVTGITALTTLVLPLTTPQALVAGTQYWLGYMNDVTVLNSAYQVDGSNSTHIASVTFSAGAPPTAPAMPTTNPTVLLWGAVTGTGVNFYEVNQFPVPGIPSYVFDSVVGHEDLYNFASLSVTPTSIYAVAVKAFCEKSDTGSRTVSLRIRSGATDSGGSLPGQGIATSFVWIGSMFETDPNGGIPWTGANLNAALTGFRIDS